VQGYESGDVERFSTKAFRDDWLDAEDWKHYRIENGYSELIEALAEDCRQHGSKIRLSCEVKRIKWKKNFLEVICTNGKRFTAPRAVIAVQLSNLQQNKILFSPALHEKAKAVRELGFGDVIKVQLLFKTKFWEEKRLQERVGKNLDKLFFLFSQEAIPTWWTQYPSSSTLLTGWLSGPAAKKLSTKTNREIVEAARNSLASIFKTDKKTISSKLKSWKVINWSKDEYTRGSYSYATVNAKKYRNIAGRPEKKTLFFAGEYLDESPGTVEAALKSGFKTASDILS
jgi:monoamine oxidase